MRMTILYLILGILAISFTQCDQAPTGPSQNTQKELTKPQLISPAHESDSVSIPVKFEWDNVDLADGYHLQIAETAEFSSMMLDSTVGGTAYKDSSLSADKTYYWRVKAISENDNGNQEEAGPWSDNQQFTTAPSQNSDESQTVNLVSPDDGKVLSTNSPRLVWESVSDIGEYHLQLSRDPDFSELVKDSVLNSSETEISKLEEDQQYYWRVEPMDEDQSAEWSKVYDFTVDNKNSSTPRVTLLTPSDGATEIDTALTFEWEPLENVSEYQLQLSTDSDFTNIVIDESVNKTSLSISGLKHSRQYYWRVQASGDDNSDNWSSVRDFTTENAPVPPVKLSSPSDGATEITTSPSLEWEALPRIDNYRVQLSKTSDFSNPVLNKIVSKNSYSVSELDYETQYYWRVQATGDEDSQNWSNTFSFQTKAESTPEVTLANPSDGSTDTQTTLTLKWEGVSGYSNYQVQLATNSDFSNLIVDKAKSDTLYQVSELDYSQKYYWRVQTKGDNSNQNWSTVFDFTIKSEPVPTVTLTSPSDGAIDLSTTPTFKWEELSGINSYKIQIATSSNFSSPQVDQSVSNTSYKASGLSKDQQYYWRVQAEGDNNSSNWSSTYSFTTKDPVPAVTLLSPSDGVTDLSISPSLEWEALSGIGTYQVQVATSSSFSSPVVDQSVSTTSKALSGLNYNQQYYWRVQAAGDDNTNNWSSAWSFTTKNQSTDGSGSVAGDRQALMELYESTDGDNWGNNSGWGDGDPSADWHGIEVNADGRVTRVDLFDNNLSGTLPASIGALNKVEYLNIKKNNLTGTIPPEIGNMESLEVLILQGRTYEIGNTLKEPPSNWNYDYHQGKYYSNTNEFSGSIPAEIGNLSNLEVLEISNAKQIVGPLPSELGNLSKLKGLYLAGINLSGYTLPSSIGNLTNLKHFYMSGTGVGGELPGSLQNLTKLTALVMKGETKDSEDDIPAGGFSGPLPDFSQFTELRRIVLSQNDLDGKFPHYFNNGNFTELNILQLSGNNLTGTLSDFNNLQDLYHIGVGGNNMTGNINTLTNLPEKIRIIQVWHNEFSGEFPQSGWPDFYQLKTAYVGWNPISGDIPCSFWEKLDNPKLGIAKFDGMDISDPCASGAEAMEGNGDIDLTY